ncbi:MAG: glycosyltransferase [Candidatus Sulfotelmatobacter sp.]
MFKPFVTVVINNFNYGRFVAEAIDSALRQTYDLIEVIVVDDGSTDDSKAVIEGYGKEIVTIFKPNEGQASAFNAGFARSSGEVICFLDADDLFLPNKVEQIAAAYRDAEIGWCFHPVQLVDALARPIPGPFDIRYANGRCDFRSEYKRGKPILWAPPTSGLTFRRGLLEKLLPMPSHIRITSDNYLTFCTPAFAPGFYISECLSLQRIHGANAYTAKEDPLFKATVQMSIASGMHDALPELSCLANRLFANAVAEKWNAGGDFQEFVGELRTYLGNCAVAERGEILARMAYRILRPRRTRAGTSLSFRRSWGHDSH